jgi:hypothetical protein
MRMGEAFKLAFLPRKGTAIYLGIIAIMFLTEYLFIEPFAPLNVLALTLGFMTAALGLKLFAGAMFGIFVGAPGDDLPRGSMLLLGMLFQVCALFLMAPMLIEAGRMYAIPLE